MSGSAYLVLVAAIAVCVASHADVPPPDPEHTVTLDVGDLHVVVGDHTAHGGSDRQSYTGLHWLSHRQYPSNVFCPLYAGMIGLRRPCQIAPVASNGAVLWIGEGNAKVSEEYIVRPPHYVDHTARFTAGGPTAWWNSTSYMNGPADPGIHLLQPDGTWVRHYSETHGDRASVAPAGMDPLPPITKVADAKYPHGTNSFSDGFSDLRFDPNYALFYGRFDHMVLIFMIERRRGSSLIPYMSPSGGGYSEEFERTNPAWDYRFWLRDLTPGQEVAIRSRVVLKPFVSEEDILTEYDRWNDELDGDA